MIKTLALLGLALAAPALPAFAQQPAAQEAAPARYVTEHEGVFDGTHLAYRAIVAETRLTDAQGTPTAATFTTSYIAKDADPAKRPVLFVFNGGPGSPSLWLQMGAIGPTRVVLPADPRTPIPADAPMVANTHSVLDVADIVFIDPPGTGYGRILPGARPGAFYTTASDANAVAEMIERWCRDNGRTASPKYLLGESYGTIRAVAVVRNLLARPQPTTFAGVILLGQAVNMIETSQRSQNVVSAVVSLPGIAAIAWYHDKAPRNGRTLDAVIADAFAFAEGPYLSALIQGHRLPEGQRRQIAATLARMTGLSPDYFLTHDLAISKEAYRTELLKADGLLLGRYDARYTAPAGGKGDSDPSSAMTPVYEARRADYYRTTLGVTLHDYVLSDPGLKGWNYGAPPSPFSDYPFAQRLADAMRKTPGMRLMIGTGIYDLTTTIGAADYLLAQTDLPAGKVVSTRYPAGHMSYTDPAVQVRLTDDLRRFITAR